MKRSLRLLFLSIIFLFTLSQATFAQKEISININGNLIKTDTPPIIRNDRVLVPVRFIAENLGLKVNWFYEEQKIAIYRPEFENTGGGIFLWIGKNIVGIDEYEEIKIDTPPIIYNNRTMVPIRVVSEIFEKDVRWDGDSRTVYIND